MRTSLETPKFTKTERVSETLNSEHAKHERPDSLRRALMDPEKPLELPRGTVVIEVGPSALNESSYNAISGAIDTTPVSAFDTEKGYLELNGQGLEDPNANEGKIALLYDSSVSPDEGKARIPAAVLVFEPLTPEQVTNLRTKLPEGVPLLDAKTNKVIGGTETGSFAGPSSTDTEPYESMGGFGGGGGGSAETATVFMEPERPKEGETPEEFEERRARQRQKEQEDQIEREAREEERKRQEAAASIVRGEEIAREVNEKWDAKKKAEEERLADIERRAQEIRDARAAAEEAAKQNAADQDTAPDQAAS